MSDRDTQGLRRRWVESGLWSDLVDYCAALAREPGPGGTKIRWEQFDIVVFVTFDRVRVRLNSGAWFPSCPERIEGVTHHELGTPRLLRPKQIMDGALLRLHYVERAQGWGEEVACPTPRSEN